MGGKKKTQFFIYIFFSILYFLPNVSLVEHLLLVKVVHMPEILYIGCLGILKNTDVGKTEILR